MAAVLTALDMMRTKEKAGDSTSAMALEVWIQEADILTMLPFDTLGTTETGRERTNSIPTVGFRAGRGASFGTVVGTTNDYVSDAVFSLGAQIDMDKTDLRDKKGGRSLLAKRTRDAVKGAAWTFNDYFINGDHATDPYGFEGVKVRLANKASTQIVYGSTSSAELDLRPAASPSEATMYQFLDRIDEAIYALDGHTADFALTDADFIRTLRGVLRRLDKYTEKAENAERYQGGGERRTSSKRPTGPALVWGGTNNGTKWYDMGLKADQSTKIIGTETVNSQACRPVFFLKIGDPYLHGIQQYSLETDGPNKQPDGVTFTTVIDWPVGLHDAHPRGIAKLAGVRVA